MKKIIMLTVVFAAGILMTTGCCSTCKTASSSKTAMTCNGSCCKDPATCAKCCHKS